MYQMKNLKIVRIYCREQIEISLTMLISKILIDLCAIKRNIIIKKHFCRYCLECFTSERVLIKQKENYLIINGKQCVTLRSGSTKFKNHFKQLAILSKIYADFEYSLKRVKSNDKHNNTSSTEKYQAHIPSSFACKVVCIDKNLAKKVVLIKEKK